MFDKRVSLRVGELLLRVAANHEKKPRVAKNRDDLGREEQTDVHERPGKRVVQQACLFDLAHLRKLHY